MRWACALMLSGCSFLGVHVPTSGPIERPNECVTSLPDLDAFVAILSSGIVATDFASGVARFATGSGLSSGRIETYDEVVAAAKVPLLVTAGVTVVSAAYGFNRVHACRAHVDDVTARMRVEALAAARAGRCDEVAEVRSRLERIGRELDMRDPSTKACFPYYCASGDDGFCACSRTESECEPAVRTALAPACVPEHVDICTARAAALTEP